MIIGEKVWNPGQMRTEISLQQRTATPDDGGFSVPVWTTVYTVKSKWSNVHGQETWMAGATGANKPATVTIRYRADLDTTWAVLKGTERYEIVSVDNIQERGELMELKVKLMAAG
jgi:SPP1 family predicted phage head-tail adaptor